MVVDSGSSVLPCKMNGQLDEEAVAVLLKERAEERVRVEAEAVKSSSVLLKERGKRKKKFLGLF